MTERLSKLQKLILIVLKEKDKIDWVEFYKTCRPNLKDPYWHLLRDDYAQPKDGDTCGSIAEVGVSNTIKKVYGHDSTFSVSFSRTLKNLISKGYLESRMSNNGKQLSEIKLTPKALNVNIQHLKVNNKEQL